MKAIARFLIAINTRVLWVGRQLAWISLTVMVAVILLQVVMRYVFNNALAWPEEAARFCMLWMTGLTAASALRWGGFVAIDMLPNALPKRLASLLNLVLFVMSATVLIVAIQYGYKHTFGFGGNFDASAMRIPLDWFGGESTRVKLRYMYASLFTGVVLLLMVNIELILRTIISLFDPDAELPNDNIALAAGAD